MEILVFNGSPRKGWDTAIPLNKALEGAALQGAETGLPKKAQRHQFHQLGPCGDSGENAGQPAV